MNVKALILAVGLCGVKLGLAADVHVGYIRTATYLTDRARVGEELRTRLSQLALGGGVISESEIRELIVRANTYGLHCHAANFRQLYEDRQFSNGNN